jgi:hypothetical protein
MIPVLYDGWSLVYQPLSPAAIHLLALLDHCPPEVQPLLALPGKTPDWLPEGITCHVEPAPDTPWGRLQWEQHRLPILAVRLGARLLHLVSEYSPLFGLVPALISPTGFGVGQPGATSAGDPIGFAGRLRQAVANGGLMRAAGVLWPEGLPSPVGPLVSPQIFRLLPLLPPGFADADHPLHEMADLPETFILYHGPGDNDSLRRALEAWRWAAGAIGEAFPLLMLGLNGDEQARLNSLQKEYGLGKTVWPAPLLAPVRLPEVYARCSALFHPGLLPPWGGPVELALYSGRPVVATDSPLTSAQVGPAGYLAPAGEARLLGAALTTVAVEESVAESLAQAARQRAVMPATSQTSAALLAAYHSILD